MNEQKKEWCVVRCIRHTTLFYFLLSIEIDAVGDSCNMDLRGLLLIVGKSAIHRLKYQPDQQPI